MDSIYDLTSKLFQLFFIHNMASIVCVLVLCATFFYIYKRFMYSEEPRQRHCRRISSIFESDENGNGQKFENFSSKKPSASRRNNRRGHRRKTNGQTDRYDNNVWPGQMLFRRIVKGHDSSSSGGSDDANDGSPRSLQRRHSSGPFQLAKAAKRLIVGGKFGHQLSMTRSTIPRPPSEFFEPSDGPAIPNHLSPAMFHLLNCLKMLDLPRDWHLDSDDIHTVRFGKGDYLFRPGDSDNRVFAVLEGSVALFIQHQQTNKEYKVKVLHQGDGVYSMLSMLDVLTGRQSIFRTVSAKALEPTRVATYSLTAFRDSYFSDPQAWSRPIHVVITRLLHVTMTTLHQYLGLGSELTLPRLDPSRQLPTFDQRVRNPSGLSAGQTRPVIAKGQKIRKLSNGEFFSDSADIRWMAVRMFADALELHDSTGLSILENNISIANYSENQVIVEQGAKNDEKLMLVVSGILKLVQEPLEMDDDDDEEEEEREERCAAFILKRELVGGLQLLSLEPAFYSIKSHNVSVVAVIDKDNFDRLTAIHPQVLLPVAASILRRLSTFLRSIDFALDWNLVDSGCSVYRQGDEADCFYVVLSGRLRSVVKNENEKLKVVIEEFGRGDMIGMVQLPISANTIEVLQRKPRSTTVLAVRYSQLARVPSGLLNFVKLSFPQVGFRMVRLLGRHYTSYYRRLLSPSDESSSSSSSKHDPMSHIKNLHTLAVVPTSRSVPLTAFVCELYHALSVNLSVLRLSSSRVAEHIDSSVLEKSVDFRLMQYLNLQEDAFPLVIYECDYTLTNWTHRCLRQADAILVVADGRTKCKPEFLEDQFFGQNVIRTNRELILLWREGTVGPTGTYDWLSTMKTGWFNGHHHILAPDRMYKDEKTLEQDVLAYYEQHVFPDKVDFYSGFSRLARILTGNAVGLVLGGGGARGASHVGVIRAMREHGIPIDIVGGVSIGSMIGGLFSETSHPDTLHRRAKSWFSTMASVWGCLWDLTYAHSAMFTGANFNDMLRRLFGDKDIDDLWIPYFCISTDITTSEMRVHRRGSLWTYCRASMSLAGYLPPLCDPVDGHLLLDGGYVNNLPADVMRSFGARCVIAVDVSSAIETDLCNYGDTLSGTWALFNRLNPWTGRSRILNMQEIQSRLAFVSSVRQLEMVKKAHYAHYLRPPIDRFNTLEFSKFDEIYVKFIECGYRYASTAFDQLVASNENIKSVMHPDKLRALHRLARRVGRRHFATLDDHLADFDRSLGSSFADLAAAMSKVPARVGVSPDEVDLTSDELDENESATENEMDVLEETDDGPARLTGVPTPRKGSDVGLLIHSESI